VVGFFAVVVCAGSDIELITSIAAIVARSCFVMDPLKMWKGIRTNKKSSEAVQPRLFFFLLLFVTHRPKQL